MWMQLGLKVEKGEIVLGPVAKDDVLLYQFLNRQVMAKSDGKLRLQGKDELRSMGIPVETVSDSGGRDGVGVVRGGGGPSGGWEGPGLHGEAAIGEGGGVGGFWRARRGGWGRAFA